MNEPAPWLRRWRFDGADEHLRSQAPPPGPNDFAIAVAIWAVAVCVWARAVFRVWRVWVRK